MTAKKTRYKSMIRSILGIVFVLVFLFPIYWMIISSLKSSGEIFKVPPSFVPENIYFENYLALFRNRDFFNYLKNSTIISVFSMIGAIILAAPMAYALARKRVKGLDALLFFIIIIQMVPGNSMALPLYGMFSKWHITNSYFGIIIANITSSLPFIVLVLRTSFLDISQALEDAARIDGCSAWGTFLKIIMPLTRPALVTCAAF